MNDANIRTMQIIGILKVYEKGVGILMLSLFQLF